MVGQRLLHYEITEKLGEGGMGVVYRAKDSKLGRTVALKVLPEVLSRDGPAMERFQREARTLALLNHRNIAAIYGFEESDGVRVIAMELVDGETLARRIARGPVPMTQALEYASQIADAMRSAHEKGIIHRDLKPANVMVTPEGQVKVLDFGLAKAIEEEPGNDPENSPTLTLGQTRTGVILGTAAYMAPEQAKGRRPDRRSDIWAFGVTLLEMLTGRRAFEGETAAEILAKVLEREPDLSLLPPETPDALRRLISHCLAKDPRTRLHDIADAWIEIAELLQPSSPAISSKIRTPKRRASLELVIRVALVSLLPLAWWVGRQAGLGDHRQQDGAGVTTHTEVSLAGSQTLAVDGQSSLAGYDVPLIDISPDGKKLVYVALADDGVTRLYSRNLNSPAIRVIAGTEGAIHPFFSPDGEWIGFLTNDQVKKVPLSGGSAVSLCTAQLGTVGTWAADGNIYFVEGDTNELSRVSALGGEVARLQSFTGGVSFGRVLPDGKAVFVTYRSRSHSGDYAEVRLMDLSTKSMRTLVPGGYDARYVHPGYVAFGRGGDLYAMAFDVKSKAVRGQPVRIVSGVRMDPLFVQAQAAFSENGILAYIPGGDAAKGRIAWMDRQGRTDFLPLEERVWGEISLSPDGSRVAVGTPDVSDYIQVYDFARGSIERIGISARHQWARWSPDSRSLAYIRDVPGSGRQLIVHQIGLGQPKVLLEPQSAMAIQDWSRDGKQILYRRFENNELQPQLAQVSPGGILSESHLKKIEWKSASFLRHSPDGRWALGYYRGEIRVFSLFSEETHQIAAGQTTEPLWCSQCSELFYRQGSKWFASRVRFSPEFQFDPPRLVFQTTGFIDTWGYSYAISPNGQRILFVKRTKDLPRDRIHIIQNWTGLLKP